VTAKLLYRPKEAAEALGMSRTAIFRLIKTGQLRSIKYDGYRLIPFEALREFAHSLEEVA
jgi:excisionase family DNA binding protein